MSAPRFEPDALQEDAERVLRTLATIEKPISSSDGSVRYMMRMLPYRTADNVINGVVMTFTDITRITAAEARIELLTADLRTRIGELETLLDLLPVGVMVTPNPAEAGLLINAYGARLLGDAVGHRGFEPVGHAVPPVRAWRRWGGRRSRTGAGRPCRCSAPPGPGCRCRTGRAGWSTTAGAART